MEDAAQILVVVKCSAHDHPGWTPNALAACMMYKISCFLSVLKFSKRFLFPAATALK
jgi:hypothetical protein